MTTPATRTDSSPSARPDRDGERPRRTRRLGAGRLHWTLAACGWAAVAVLAVVAIARIADWDATGAFATVDAANAVVYLPAWAVLLAAGIGRRPWLALAAGAVVAAQLAFAAPELLAARPLPAWVAGAPHLAVFDANVGSDVGNEDMSGLVAEIARARPDLVTLEEVSPGDVAQLAASGAFADLRYRYEADGNDPWGTAIASRYPLRHVLTYSTGGSPYLVTAMVELPSGPLRLWAVHTATPVLSLSSWRGELDSIARRARTSGLGDLLVAGDFNASWGNAGFHAIVEAGLADGAAARSTPYAMTWPQGYPFPPLFRLDHLLAGTGVSVTRIGTVDAPGSDHHGLVATVAVEPRSRYATRG